MVLVRFVGDSIEIVVNTTLEYSHLVDPFLAPLQSWPAFVRLFQNEWLRVHSLAIIMVFVDALHFYVECFSPSRIHAGALANG